MKTDVVSVPRKSQTVSRVLSITVEVWVLIASNSGWRNLIHKQNLFGIRIGFLFRVELSSNMTNHASVTNPIAFYCIMVKSLCSDARERPRPINKGSDDRILPNARVPKYNYDVMFQPNFQSFPARANYYI